MPNARALFPLPLHARLTMTAALTLLLVCLLLLQAFVGWPGLKALLFLAAGYLLLSSTILISLSMRLRKGLASLRHDLERLEQEDYAATFQAKGRDELGKLEAQLARTIKAFKERLGFAQGVIKGMDTACVVVDTDEILTYTNQGLLDILEHDGRPEDYFGQNVAHFFYGDASRKTVLSESLRSHAHVSKEVELTSRKGNVRRLIIDSSPLFDLEGQLMGALCIYRNITELRATEAAVIQQKEQLEQAAQQAVAVAEKLASAAEELSNQIEQMSLGADNQQKRASEVSAAMEEMNRSVLEISKNAADAAKNASSMRSKASEGEEVVEKVSANMADVNGQAVHMRESMHRLREEVHGITDVLDMINDIADQTNLLALNAAIEAARAGEAGRGFAVVADEVRKLAEKTMQATKEVGATVESITGGTEQNVQAMQQTESAVAETEKLTAEAKRRLQEIVRFAESNSSQVESIATASEQQSSASDQVNQSTENVNAIALETAEALKESAEAVNDFNQLASELNDIVERMRSQAGTA